MQPDQPPPFPNDCRLQRLNSRLARLEAAAAVKRLQRAFGYYLDQGLWDEVADLFTADASLEVALDGVFTGRDRIRRFFYELGQGRRGLSYGELHECLQVQPVVHITADEACAKGRWRALILCGRQGERASWAEGPYENEYRCDQGIWKISRLHWYQTFQVPYEGGWAGNIDATGGTRVSGTLRPDAEPTELYDVWPGVYTPAFHYTSAGAWGNDEIDPAADEPALAALERRTLRLEDAAAIENLIGAYGYFLDKQQWDRLVELFAADGSMEVSLRGVYVGRRSIRRALELFGPQGIQPGYLHNHLQLQPVIHIAADGRRAWARSRALSQLGTYQGTALWHGGIYECEFVKVAGVWKYKHDHIYTTYFADYERGWAHGARAAPKPSDAIPPDLPPTEQYDVFPGRYVPPFHYPHPVTGMRISAVTGHAPAQETALAALGTHSPAATIRTTTKQTVHAVAALQRLEDVHSIEILQRTYGYLIDKGLCAEATELFSANGTIEIAGLGRFVGRERILEYLTGHCSQGGAPGGLFEFMQLQSIITVADDGSTASGRWRWFLQSARYGEKASWGLGILENEYVKADGVWRIWRIEAHPRLSASYAGGWLQPAIDDPATPTAPAPDLTPAHPASPYPQPFSPPCRFVHPVTGQLPAGSTSASNQPRTPRS